MRPPFVLAVPGILILLWVSSPAVAWARHRHHYGSTHAPAAVVPGEISGRLTGFLNRHLESAILAPLEKRVRLPRKELGKLSLEFNQRLALAAPAGRPALEAALALCERLSGIMDERERLLHAPLPEAAFPPPVAGMTSAISGPSNNGADASSSLPTTRREKRHLRRRQDHLAQMQQKQLLTELGQRWIENCSVYRKELFEETAKVLAAEAPRESPALVAPVRPETVPAANAAIGITPLPPPATSALTPAVPARDTLRPRTAPTTTVLPPDAPSFR